MQILIGVTCAVLPVVGVTICIVIIIRKRQCKLKCLHRKNPKHPTEQHTQGQGDMNLTTSQDSNTQDDTYYDYIPTDTGTAETSVGFGGPYEVLQHTEIP